MQKKPQITMSETAKYFQGIGCLYGTPFLTKSLGWSIKIKDEIFRLFISPSIYRAWLSETRKNQELYLVVYPKSFFNKGTVTIFFQVVFWSRTPIDGYQPGRFLLKGIWGFIPQYRYPVMTIYRNIKTKSLYQLKPSHIPIIMKRDDCQPYRFCQSSGEEKPERWFIEGSFRFIPKMKAFGHINDLKPASNKIPKYRKNASKYNKILSQEKPKL